MYLLIGVTSYIERCLAGIWLYNAAIVGRRIFIDHGKAEEPKLRVKRVWSKIIRPSEPFTG